LDRYDQAISYFSQHPHEIMAAWKSPHKHVAGCLFQKATKSGFGHCRGCLTEVRRWVGMPAETPELTKAIRADHRIPTNPDDISVDKLDVFAEWQRRIDRELRNNPNIPDVKRPTIW